MADYEKIKEIVEKLHVINFGETDGIIKHEDCTDENKSSFTYEKRYNGEKEEFIKDDIIGYCVKCNKENTPTNGGDNSCKLCNISHGSHTFDFIESFGLDVKSVIATKEWKDTPVVFLMENPSKDYGIYDYINSDKNKEGKRPAKKWYWIHRNSEIADYETDKYLVMQKYGEMVASLIVQFKLANAYLTNAVKCGMSDAQHMDNGEIKETRFLGTSDYSNDVKKNCLENVLMKEIGAIASASNERVIIFAFGGNAYWLCKELLFHNGIQAALVQLPHPSARMNNKYRPYVLKGIVEDVLFHPEKYEYNGSFVNTDEFKNQINDKLNDKLNSNIVCSDCIKINGKRNNQQITVTIREYDGLFGNASNNVVKEVIFRGDTNNKLFGGNYGFGYNFFTDEFWCWDYDNNDYIEPNKLMEPYYEVLLEIINELK